MPKAAASQGQGTLGSFFKNRKRSAPARQPSPTNQTSSPENKKTQSEEFNHEPDAILISPQRDKNSSTTTGETEDPPPEDPNTPTEAEEEQNAPQNPRSEEASEAEVAAEPSKEPSNPPSILKTTYSAAAAAAAHLPDPPPLIPRWETRRVAIMFDIKRPSDRNKRTAYLSSEINKMLECMSLYTKVYVRKFKEHMMPQDSEKRTWIKKFDKDRVSDLTFYTHGFYFYQDLRSGTFRLLLQLVLPTGTNIQELMVNVNGHKWASKNNRSLRDIREQHLHSPKYVGWLFRSNYSMVSSPDLQTMFESIAGIHFGLNFKSVPLPRKGKYDPATAIKAVCVMCNESDQQTAWSFLMKWYNAEKPTLPLGIPMRFIPSMDHPDILNNMEAAQNISTILDRQRVFLRDTEITPCPQLSSPDLDMPNGRTLRQELVDLTAITMGDDLRGSKLFHAITRKVDFQGSTVYQFTFHKAVRREAKSILSGMGQFIDKELNLDADYYCHPHLLHDDHDWDVKKRSVINATTCYISNLAILTESEKESMKEQEDEYPMDDKARRESARILRKDEEETVPELTKKKAARSKPSKDAESVRSGVSNLTAYSSSTKASIERKRLRKKLGDQKEVLDAKDEEIRKLTAALNAKLGNSQTMDGSPTESHSGESTSEVSVEEVVEEEDEAKSANSVEATPIKPVSDAHKMDNGLTLVFRGSPSRAREAADIHTQRGDITFQTPPFKDGTVTVIDVYKVVDQEKFKHWHNQPDQSVKFAPQAEVQEYDTETGMLEPKSQKIDTREEDSDISMSGESASEASQSPSSSQSSSASQSSSSSESSSSSSSHTTDEEMTETPQSQNRQSVLTASNISNAEKAIDLAERAIGVPPENIHV